MGKIFIKIRDEIIYGGHLQCLGVSGIVYISSILLNFDISWKLLVIAYLIFYPIYVYDRLRGIRLDEFTNPERTLHLKGYLPLIPKIVALSIGILAILLIYIGNLKLFIFSLLLLLLGILYPIFLKNVTKKIIAFKNIYVSGFFTAMPILPVIFYSHHLDDLSKLTLAAFTTLVFVKTLLMQILLDCKDIEGDKPLGLLTIPVLIGKKKTLNLLKVSSLLITSVILFLSIILIPSFPVKFLILLITIPFNFYTYNLSFKDNLSAYTLGGGEFLLWFILIFTTKIIL